MTKSDIVKITDECKLTGVGYDENENTCYRICEFDDGTFGFIQTIGGNRTEYRVQAATTAQAVIKLNEFLNGNLPQVPQAVTREEIKEEGMAPTRKGMSVDQAKAYLEQRGLDALVPGGFSTIKRMQAGG